MRASEKLAPAAFAAVSASARSSLIGSSSNALTPRGYVGSPAVNARPSSGRSTEPVAASAAALPVFLRKSRRVVMVGFAFRWSAPLDEALNDGFADLGGWGAVSTAVR